MPPLLDRCSEAARWGNGAIFRHISLPEPLWLSGSLCSILALAHLYSDRSTSVPTLPCCCCCPLLLLMDDLKQAVKTWESWKWMRWLCNASPPWQEHYPSASKSYLKEHHRSCDRGLNIEWRTEYGLRFAPSLRGNDTRASIITHITDSIKDGLWGLTLKSLKDHFWSHIYLFYLYTI